MSDLDEKNLPGISQGRMGKLQRRVDKLQRESNEQQVLLNGLEKRFQQFEKYQSIKALVTVLNTGFDAVAKAIRESGSGVDQATLKKMAEGVAANTQGVVDAQKE